MRNMAFPHGPVDFSGLIPSGVPSYDDIMSGRDMLRFEKVPVRFSDFHAKIFDMTVPEEAEEYGRTVLDIMRRVQARQCVILRHDTREMKCRDGVDGWKNYLEWASYEVNDTLIDQIRKSDGDGSPDGTGRKDGVFAEI